MLLTILLFPLLNFLILIMFGKNLKRKGAEYISIFALFSSFLVSIVAFLRLITDKQTMCWIYTFNKWFSIDLLIVKWGFLFDTLSLVMCVTITLISFLVHLYSCEYMSKDPNIIRFLAYLSLFTFFMLLLVTSSNFVQLFFGWEGVGLSSYLLINFWYTRLQANKAAIKAMLVNRIGDFGLLVAILIIFEIFKTTEFGVIFAIINQFVGEKLILFHLEFHAISVIAFFLFLGVVGKSAQFGLHTWSPDAMEGPTPVSALLHAATMVTAGVFVLVRCSPIFEKSPSVLTLVVFIGALTIFLSSTVGLVQNDLKKVIAYSTCSQLGYMVMSCGLSNYFGSMLHLVNHAFFKALLFLCAGAIIHALNDEQDMRRMGGLVNLLPYTYVMMLTASLSLMGFPFLTGFYSKDFLLEFAHTSITVDARFAYYLSIFGAFITSIYSWRVLNLVFYGKPRFHIKQLKFIHEVPKKMAIPLFILWTGSIFLGYFIQEWFIGPGALRYFWKYSIHVELNNQFDYIFLPFWIKIIPFIFSLFGIYFGIKFHRIFNFQFKWHWNREELKLLLQRLEFYKFLNGKWLFDYYYNKYIVTNTLKFGYNITFKTIDRGLLEIIGPLGLVRIIRKLKFLIFSGQIYHYLLVMILGVCSYIAIFQLNLIRFLNFDLELFILLFILIIFITFFKIKK